MPPTASRMRGDRPTFHRWPRTVRTGVSAWFRVAGGVVARGDGDRVRAPASSVPRGGGGDPLHHLRSAPRSPAPHAGAGTWRAAERPRRGRTTPRYRCPRRSRPSSDARASCPQWRAGRRGSGNTPPWPPAGPACFPNKTVIIGLRPPAVSTIRLAAGLVVWPRGGDRPPRDRRLAVATAAHDVAGRTLLRNDLTLGPAGPAPTARRGRFGASGRPLGWRTGVAQLRAATVDGVRARRCDLHRRGTLTALGDEPPSSDRPSTRSVSSKWRDAPRSELNARRRSPRRATSVLAKRRAAPGGAASPELKIVFGTGQCWCSMRCTRSCLPMSAVRR